MMQEFEDCTKDPVCRSFRPSIAMQYGIACALLLENIYYSIKKNRKNGCNYYMGRYWLCSSAKKLQEVFPCFTAKQIIYALNRLRKEGILAVGNFNKCKYDKTHWYALTDKGEALFLAPSSPQGDESQ